MPDERLSLIATPGPLPPIECDHTGWFTAEVDGYENVAEPLCVRITCSDCHAHIDVRIEDVPFLPWEKD